MAQKNLKVRSGNRVIIALDGKQIGTMKSVSMDDDYSPEAVTGIGDIHVVEHVPSVARHSLSCSYVVLNRKSLREQGVVGENGDAALQGLVFDILQLDKDTGEVLRKYIGCTYASGGQEVSANAVLMANARFMALDVTGLGG